MEMEPLRRRRDVLKHLYQRVKDWESFFLSPVDLQSLGIQVFQVRISDDGIIQSHPCFFFLPYPERVLQKYPLDTLRIGADDAEDSNEGSPVPHAIMTTVAHVPANHADQSLTIHEVRAIMNMMIIRTSNRPFRKYPIHPLLVLSYMGGQHGRIIQALFDGENLVLQYSQLWSFEDENTAPVELFIRYNISRPVGLESLDMGPGPKDGTLPLDSVAGRHEGRPRSEMWAQ
ncbi:hypothetical protein N7463_004173 [Penicillium fimorum]|uniref:Uncharacterized protein n=1 Tax=Penicillium fimorum TaxID=1882269 RepID=A0A9W9Y2C2_9EURO|nr:hypothetical protein N7463_004173 [Penicillium fimorum]